MRLKFNPLMLAVAIFGRSEILKKSCRQKSMLEEYFKEKCIQNISNNPPLNIL